MFINEQSNTELLTINPNLVGHRGVGEIKLTPLQFQKIYLSVLRSF